MTPPQNELERATWDLMAPKMALIVLARPYQYLDDRFAGEFAREVIKRQLRDGDVFVDPATGKFVDPDVAD